MQQQRANYDLPVMDTRQHQLRPALCLDFDGTIRYSKSGQKFIQGPDDIALYPGVEAKLWEYRENGFLICGVSNQGGVAFMIRPQSAIEAEMDATLALFERNPFHAVKWCLHHPKGKHPALGHRSLMRKPDIGMLVMHEFEMFNAGYIIDWANSLFVGDREEDQECANRADIAFEWAGAFFGFEQSSR